MLAIVIRLIIPLQVILTVKQIWDVIMVMPCFHHHHWIHSTTVDHSLWIKPYAFNYQTLSFNPFGRRCFSNYVPSSTGKRSIATVLLNLQQYRGAARGHPTREASGGPWIQLSNFPWSWWLWEKWNLRKCALNLSGHPDLIHEEVVAWTPKYLAQKLIHSL